MNPGASIEHQCLAQCPTHSRQSINVGVNSDSVTSSLVSWALGSWIPLKKMRWGGRERERRGERERERGGGGEGEEERMRKEERKEKVKRKEQKKKGKKEMKGNP